jgi:cysteine desulfurase
MSNAITYLDNNATTRPDDRVTAAMLPLLTDFYGNPSSAHYFGAQVAVRIEEARRDVAALIGARESEIVFTSGGTESDNAGLRGVLSAQPEKRHLIISAVEHHAVFETAERLEQEGIHLTRVGVDGEGRLDLDGLRAAIRDDTGLISIMLANNETGVIFPLAEVCAIAGQHGVPVHTDAVNALGKMPVDVGQLGVSLLSLSAHKIYGPKGVGALCVRRGTPFRACQTGGSHERNRRGGTLNAPGIIGLGTACRILAQEQDQVIAHVAALRAKLEAALGKRFPEVRIMGQGTQRLPNTTCACFAGLPSEPLVLLLSEAGVCVSSGSACTSGSLELSHVLQAMNVDPQVGQGEIRFSLGKYNTEQDLERLFEVLPRIVEKVRAGAEG